MVKLSIVLVAMNNMDKNNINSTIYSIKNQTFQDFEILCSESVMDYVNIEKMLCNNKIKFITTLEDDSNIYLTRSLKQSNGKYIYFMRIGDEFSNTTILSNLIKQLEKNNSQLIQYKKTNNKEDYPKNYREDLINIHNASMFYESVFLRDYLINSLDFEQIKNIPYYELILLTDITLNIENYIFTNKKITSTDTEEKIEEITDITEYLTVISQITKKLLENNKTEYIDLLSQNLQEINFNKIKITAEDELIPIKENMTNINRLISKEDNALAYYYFNKYFRCIIDVLYNNIHEFDISISIIIPTYNVENYIHDCINSILNQEMDDIEIICVDDLSTDSTRDVLNYYSQKHSNIRCFHMKEKHGSGGCRNYGLKQAKGKYIYFMDSDDWIDPNSLKNIYEMAQTNKTQILMFKNLNYMSEHHEFDKGNYFVMEHLTYYLNRLFSIDDIKRNDLFRFNVVPWNKLYLKSFLDNIHVKFVENLIHQDEPFFYETMVHADRIYFIDEYYYNYRKRDTSITQLANKVELGTIQIIEYMLLVFIKNSIYSIYKKKLLKKLFEIFCSKYNFINEEFKEEYFIKSKKMINKFRNEYKMDEDLNNYLTGLHKKFYESIMLSEDYQTFKNNYQKK